MPSRSVHIGKAKSFVRAVNQLLAMKERETLIDPLATLAYYAVMHAFEACFAQGIGARSRTHFTNHPDRVNQALKNKHVFGHKPANAFRTLYDFSRVARYSQDKAGAQQTPTTTKPLGQDQKTLKEVIRRLDRCIKKNRELLGASIADLPDVDTQIYAPAESPAPTGPPEPPQPSEHIRDDENE